MAYSYYKSTVYKIVQETDLVRRFFFKVPDEIEFNFKAGQFIMLNLPIESKFTNRSYSIASAPNNENTFELAIVLNPTGLGTPYLWENVEVGSEIETSKTLGKFTITEPIENDIALICTGTGIAPLRSMVHHILENQISHKKIYMIFGNRFEKDIIYRKEMEEMEHIHPSFEFIPVLSRDNEGWKGKSGYVHAVYEEIFKDKRPATFYMCGWRDMLVDARARLEKMGYDKKQIRFESYD